MKVEPLFSFKGGILAGAGGKEFPAVPAQMRLEDFSAGVAEANIATLAAEGANLILLRLNLSQIALKPASFNEAALSRLREILKTAEERSAGAVLSIEDERDAASPSAQADLISAAEHTARRLKDCASLIGFAVPEGAGQEFLLELEARFEKKHPTLLFFVPPQATKEAEGGEKDSVEKQACRPPFVSPMLWPRAWALEKG